MSFAGKFLTKVIQSITLEGELVLAAIAGTTGNIKVMFRDEDRYIMYATGTDVPSDATAGYAKGCLFVDTNVAAATTGLYVNIGAHGTSCDFDAVSDA